jgi:hypothetical protein
MEDNKKNRNTKKKPTINQIVDNFENNKNKLERIVRNEKKYTTENETFNTEQITQLMGKIKTGF